ncbi:MAG: Gfo/Idh/MocA family oxidoreductase, partial [Pseudolabrys sp.]
NPDRDLGIDYRADWKEVAGRGSYINSYRMGWENFLRHVADDAPLTNDFAAGVRDVQLAQACYRSLAERKWVSLQEIIG